MSIELNISSTNVYSGNLNFKFKINNKLVDIHKHNKGLSGLFLLFAKSLIGKATSDDRVAYLRISGKDSNSQEISLIKNLIPLTGGFYSRLDAETIPEDEKPYKTTFTATFAASNLVDLSEDTKINSLLFRLVSANKNYNYTEIEITDPDTVKSFVGIPENTNIVVEWEMSVSNPQTQTANLEE